MKKLILILFVLNSISIFSQENETWRIGAQWGFHGNSSYLTGGDEEANSRFQNNNAGNGAFTLVGRFDFNKHWMLMSGFGFNSYGFEYALTENYSAAKNERNYSVLKSNFSAFEIPIMAHYKFNPNCKNGKWLVGFGFAQSIVFDEKKSAVFEKDAEPNYNSNYLTSTTEAKGGIYGNIRFSIGYEKVYKKGNILNVGLYFNVGFKEIAKSTATYVVDKKSYTHEYGNNGDYVGIKLSYFLKPFAKKM